MSDLIRRDDVLALFEQIGSRVPIVSDLDFHDFFGVKRMVEALPAVKAVELADDVYHSEPIGWLVYRRVGKELIYSCKENADAVADLLPDGHPQRGRVYPLYAGKPEDVICR
jgi:hypothetical protein